MGARKIKKVAKKVLTNESNGCILHSSTAKAL